VLYTDYTAGVLPLKPPLRPIFSGGSNNDDDDDNNNNCVNSTGCQSLQLRIKFKLVSRAFKAIMGVCT